MKVMVSGTSLRGAGHVITPSRKKLKLGQEHREVQAWSSSLGFNRGKAQAFLAAHQTVFAFLDV